MHHFYDEVVFYYSNSVPLPLEMGGQLQLVENWGDESVPVTRPRSMID